MIAGVAVSLGIGALICKAADTINKVNIMTRFLVHSAGAAAVAKLLDVIISVLSSGAYRKIPKWNLIGILVVVALAVIENIAETVKSFMDDANTIDDVSTLLKAICDRIDILNN